MDKKAIENDCYEKVHQDDTTEQEQKQEPYGWGKIRPKCLQWLNRPCWFLIFVSVAHMTQGLCVNGLIGVTISTLERRFNFSSTWVSLIPAIFDFASIPVTFVVGFFGGSCNRPKWIAFGMLFLCIASIVYAMPHFTTGIYEYSDATFDDLCHVGTNATDRCDIQGQTSDNFHNYIYLFISTTLLLAMGYQPIVYFPLTYIDDSLSRSDSSLYIGIFYGCGAIGAAAGYIGGGYLLDIYTDVDVLTAAEIGIGRDDPRWVGAWWIGFLITGILSLLTVIPLLGFPEKMHYDDKDGDKDMETHTTDSDSDDVLSTQLGFGNSLRELPAALKVLCKNPTYILCTFVGVFNNAILNAFISFGPKYLENQFSINASTAGMLFGLIAVPGAAGGSIAGGLLIKKLKMNCTDCIRGLFISSMTFLALSGVFFLRCDNTKMYGVNVVNSSALLPASCLGSCDCSPHSYNPVCGADNVTYFSPCYAGCQESISDGEAKIYTNCTCLDPHLPSSSAAEGLCPVDGCIWLPLFCVLLFIGMLCVQIERIFQTQVTFRCVQQNQRSLGLGFGAVISGFLGYVPGNILFALLLDGSCILWAESCHGTGSCLLYNNDTMSYYTLIFTGLAKLATCILAFAAWRIYKANKSARMQKMSFKRVQQEAEA